MQLGMEEGLGPDDFVLDGDPAPPSPKGGRDPQIFGPCLLRPNGWMDEAGTWHRGRSQPRQLCVRWGPSSPSPKWGGAPPQFSAHVYCGQRAGGNKMLLGMEVGLGPGHIALDGDPAHPLPKRHSPTPSHTQKIRPMSVLAKCLNGSRCHLVVR